jgi:hypothetical protein
MKKSPFFNGNVRFFAFFKEACKLIRQAAKFSLE